jgi:hypothetical protein
MNVRAFVQSCKILIENPSNVFILKMKNRKKKMFFYIRRKWKERQDDLFANLTGRRYMKLRNGCFKICDVIVFRRRTAR